MSLISLTWLNVFDLYYIKCLCSLRSVGDLGFDPGSLNRATGEKVTVSDVNRVFRGTGNRQSVLGSWGPSAAREGRPKGDITSLTSSCIPPIIILFLILSLLLRTGGSLSSNRE